MPLRDKKLSAKDFLAQADKSIHAQIIRVVEKFTQCEGVVMFENMDMCSSQLGQRQFLVVGPDNTFKSVDECDGKWLNDLPSQRQYPQNWCSAADLKARTG